MAKKATINKNIREFRKEKQFSLQEFADYLNTYLGEVVYSKDAIYRIDADKAKVSAEFVWIVSQAFDVPLARLYQTIPEATMDDLKDEPPLLVTTSVASYKSFIQHVKGMAGEEDPLLLALYHQFEAVADDLEQAEKQNERYRGKLEMIKEIIQDIISISK